MELTPQEIQKLQGTRLSEKAPWETYNTQMAEKLDPELEKEIAKYAENRYEEGSNQSKEELHRQKEMSDAATKEYQFIHPDEYKDEGPRIGKIIHSSKFINLLKSDCNINCWYREHPQPKKITLMVKRNGMEPEVGCWAQLGFMPEYEIIRFDDHGLPLDSKFRGWRTCCLQLILKGILTEEDSDKVFGKATGPASKRYLDTLYGFRNQMIRVKEEYHVRGN